MIKKDLTVKGIIFGVLLIFVAGTAYSLFIPAFKGNQKSLLYVDTDDNTDSVKTKIKALNPSAMLGFQLLFATTSFQPHTGRYEAAPGESTLTFYRKVRNGRQTPLNLTIPSVRTMDRLALYLGSKLMIDSTEIADALYDSTFCQQFGYDTATIACLFIPNTYQIYWNTSLEDFMNRMKKENKQFWSQERLQKAQNAGLTPNQVITLASIVDEETAANAEKPAVAGMYLNRLKQGMPLQADPTIKFALKDFSLRRIYHKHLDIQSPYNTYRNIGLPPGPIRIPSIAGIDAVLNYDKHDFLYMCAKEDFSGRHNFARTYQEHLNNAAKYTKALNERGIK